CLCSWDSCAWAHFSPSLGDGPPSEPQLGPRAKVSNEPQDGALPYGFRLQSQPDRRRAWPAGIRTALQTVYRLPQRSFVASAFVSWTSAQRWRTCCRSASASKKLREMAQRRGSRPRQASSATIEYFRAQQVLSQGEMGPRCTP